MSLTIADIMQMEPFFNFRLLAGMNGIERRIERVNILDFEYIPAANPDIQSGSFETNALVLSTLLFAKDHPEQLLDTVKQLIEKKTSALMIKTVIYSEVPQEVIDYANEKAYPIFTFGKNDGYFEDIITYVSDEIKSNENSSYLEQKLTLLTGGYLSRLETHTLVRELFPDLTLPYQLAAIYVPAQKPRYSRKIRNLQETLHIPLLPFRNLLLTLPDSQNEAAFTLSMKEICEGLGVPTSACHIGCSSIHESIEDFPYAIKESQYACTFSRKTGKNPVYFQDLGLRQIFFPYQEDYWMVSYCRQIIQKIETYDADYNSDLLQTAITYIQSGANVQQAAQTLHIHKNTVRYRIQKLQEILNMEQTVDFYEQLALAIQFHIFTK